MKASALEHTRILDSDLCKLLKTYDDNNTDYSYCLETF